MVVRFNSVVSFVQCANGVFGPGVRARITCFSKISLIRLHPFMVHLVVQDHICFLLGSPNELIRLLVVLLASISIQFDTKLTKNESIEVFFVVWEFQKYLVP